MYDLPPKREDGYFLDLHPHQIKSVRETSSLIDIGSQRILVVSPTGSGKMNIALEMGMQSISHGLDTCFLVHRTEVAEDFVERARRAGVKKIDVIIASSEARDPSAKLHVATYGTLAHRVLPRCDLCLPDEAHRILAKSHLRMIEQLSPRWTVGFTGSPWRLDRQPLNKFFDAMVVAAQPMELVEAGYLAAAKVWGPRKPEDEISVAGVGFHGDDFDPQQLAKAAGHRHLIGAIVDHWKMRASDLLTIAFCAGVKNADDLAIEFNAAGVPAARVDGTMNASQRRAVLARMASGEIRVATTADIWIEGVDLPSLKCAILARPTMSLTVYLQSVGRVFRPYQGLNAVILDHAGNTRRHKLPQIDRKWSIEPKDKKRSKAPELPHTKSCPGMEGECRAELAITTRVCPECGHVFIQDRTLEVIDEELVELTKDVVAKNATEAAKKAAFTRFWLNAYRDGFDCDWVTRRYADRFGDAPPADWTPPDRPKIEYTVAQKRAQLAVWQGVAQRQRLPRAWVESKYLNKFQELPSSLGEKPAEKPVDAPAQEAAKPDPSPDTADASDKLVELEF